MKPEIKLSKIALQKNLELLCQTYQTQNVFPVIKANAYGHGDFEMAELLLAVEKKLNPFPYFCVAQMGEARALRRKGIEKDILVLSHFDTDELKTTPRGVSLVLSSLEEIENISSLDRETLAKISSFHLKFNTGMNRIGIPDFSLDDEKCFERFVTSLDRLIGKKECVVDGLMSHFSRGECDPEKFSNIQLERFVQIIEKISKQWKPDWGDFPKWRHIANSPAMLHKVKDDRWINSARPGIHMYGLWGNSEDRFDDIELNPVLSLRAPLKSVYWVEQGQGVGYGGNFVAARKTLLGIVNLGYADGVRREFSVDLDRNAYFFVGGEACPIVGNISMDMTAIELTNHSMLHDLDALKDEFAEFIGPSQSAEFLARQLNTISYEILTSLSTRIRRKVF